MKKKLLSLFIVFVFVLTSFSSFTTSSGIVKAIDPDPIVTVEQAVLDEMQTKGSASYWIQFKNAVDLSPAYTMNWSDRGWFVYKTLQKQAEVTQAQVKSYLTGSKVEFKSYWINNSILVTSSTKTALNDLLKFDGIESIQARKTYKLYEPDTSAALLDNGINAIEPNLTHVNADEVWALGIDGAGLVVANIDTGVRYTHQALVGQYRGNLGGTFNHNYNWWDPYGDHPTAPADDNGHGSHTMGTMVGDDGGANQIGIAPGANWIACRGCSTTACSDAALLSCGQFVTAPTDLSGANADPDLRANAVNNSWGDCEQTYNNWYEGPINAWHAAGIYPIFSNGNASNCSYASPPGLNTVGNPARSGNVTGVGSSGQQNGQYATHSNWGPTDNLDIINPVDPFAMLKPQVLAPGVNIRSSTSGSDTSYESWAGTSMSAPHVTGLVALIWQAAPCLIGDYAATETLIESTAVDMVYDDGSTLTPTNFPNFATGWGEIDALAAVNDASGMCTMGTLEGMVTTDGTTPVEDAKIFADNGAGYTRNIYTAADGTYSSGLPAGTYTLTASKYGYQSQTVTGVVITEDGTTVQDFNIPQLGMSLVSGYVYDGGVEGLGAHGYPLYSSIHITATEFDETIYTDPFTGYYEIELLDSQPYNFGVQAVPTGYDLLTESVTPTGVTYTKDFDLMVDSSCSAPGYLKSTSITLSEGFESGALPTGWVNYDYIGNGQVWQFDDPGNRGNLTPGGEGGFAIIDSDYYGISNNQDAGLRTPSMNFTGEASVVLDFDTDFNYYSSADSAIVWVSNDGGLNWTTVWTQTADFNGHVTLDISAQAANQANVIVEFNYVGTWGYWWQVDDVVISSIDCNLAEGGVVAGYVYDDNDNSPLVGADVYSDVVETQTFFIPEDPASEGLYWVFHPVMGPVKSEGVQSLSGSNIVFNPTAGGDPGYIPGVPATLCFESNVYSPDWEYSNHTWLNFPMDWVISTTYLVGTPTCDNGYWGPFSVSWETEPYEINVYHTAYNGIGGAHCIADYCVDVTPGASEGLVSWYYDGDNFANAPHHPCSSDVYTPGSMAAAPCDEWVNPQASIPMLSGEAHEFTAEKDLYGSDTETVFVVEDLIVQQDFYLGTGELVFDPLSLEATMLMGDAPYSETLTISNLGTSDAMFEIVEKDDGFELPMIPAFKGELPEDTRPTSIGLAPNAGTSGALSASEDYPFKGILAGEPAFAVDLMTDSLKLIPDTTLPGTWTDIGSTMTSLFAGDFLAGDFTTLYAISYDNNNLYTVDVATGSATLVGTSTPPGGQSWTGLSGTPDGTLYGLTTDITASTLVTVDPGTGAVTVLGTLPGLAGGIDLAYNTDDDMIYIVDLITDSLFRVDPTTLATTLVGSLGAAPNYAQGMDYEEESGVLYWAAYTTTGELRIIDTATGASTLVGAFPGGAEVDCLAFTTGGQSDVPWLSEDPISGTVPAEGSIDVTVTFDPTGAGLTQPGNYLAELKVKHDTPYTYPNVPVVLHLIAPGDYGTFNGHVMGLEACDVNPAALEGATVNFWQSGMIEYTTTTNAEGYYSYAVPEGIYDIEVMADGYMSEIEFGQEVLGGSTVPVDFTLRLEAPCISVDPTSLEQTQIADTVTSQTLTIMNTGAGDGVFELFEMEATGLHADVELIVDDGVAEDSIGVTDSVSSYQFVWMNRFTPNPDAFPFNLEEISILWPSGQVTTGSSVELVVYQDLDADGDPTNAELVGTYMVTIQNVNGTTWDVYPLATPLSLDGPGDILIGAINRWVTSGVSPAEWPANIDMTASQVRSWAGWWNADPPVPPVLPPDASWGLIDSLGFAGNWMIRGAGSSATADIVWLSLDPTAGVVLADSSTDVTVTYDSTGLAEGDYFAAIRVKNPPAAAINVPVTLHVTNWNYLYLPLILK